MQTFLPYADFARSAESLDMKRLGKQRVENLQIMKTLQTGKGWVHHPAVKMWEGYEPALMKYQFAITHEWTEVRGYKDTCFYKTLALMPMVDQVRYATRNFEMPPWLGNEDFHERHRSMLIEKFPEYYGPLFDSHTRIGLTYKWPTQDRLDDENFNTMGSNA